MSRLQNAAKAVRPTLRARLMLAGPAGSGKTWSALTIAQELGDDTLVIDTERESALTYADEFDFTHLPWQPPYDPRELGETLSEAGDQHKVVIVDSFSHFWTGSGGTLDIADGRFGGWKTARPAQVDVVTALLSCSAHVIVCVRSKIEYAQELDARSGKQVVKKLGMSPQQDATLEYELNLAAEIDIDHRISVSKSRTVAVPVGRTFTAGHAVDLAKLYAGWLDGGEPLADLETRAAIDTARTALPDDAKRDLWQAWQDKGLPRNVALLTVSQAETAQALIESVRHD